MAKLSARGRTQIAERTIGHTVYRLMSDGVVLKNFGYGWTVAFHTKHNITTFTTQMNVIQGVHK